MLRNGRRVVNAKALALANTQGVSATDFSK